MRLGSRLRRNYCDLRCPPLRIPKQLPQTNIFPPWNTQHCVRGRSLSYFRSGKDPAFGKNAQSIVLVDSQAAIKALIKCTVASIIELNCIGNLNQLGKLNHVSIAWIPGHAGVHGNEVADYVAKSGFKSKTHGPETFITVPHAGCVSTVKDWSTDRWKSMWNERKDCLRMKECVGGTFSRLTIRLFNLKRPQLNRVVHVLTGHCNLQRYKKSTGRAESSLCPKCSLEDETPNHHVSNCKLYHDIRVKYFGITKTTVHNAVKKCNINKLVTCLNEAGRLCEFDQ